MEKIKISPRDMTQTIGIPLFVTENHNEVFQFWQRLRNADLIHIDAHPDLTEGAKYFLEIPQDYSTLLGIEQFICPAFHYGLISSMYYLNPQLNRLHFIGSTDSKTIEDRIRTQIKSPVDKKEEPSIEWLDSYPFPHFSNLIKSDRIQLNETNPFVLDIDLDAFCCDNCFINYKNKAVDNYQGRIDSTQKILSELKRPNLITITRSQGDGIENTFRFVPRNLVDEVQNKTLEMLRAVYQT